MVRCENKLSVTVGTVPLGRSERLPDERETVNDTSQDMWCGIPVVRIVGPILVGTIGESSSKGIDFSPQYPIYPLESTPLGSVSE
jgi:hypothetical protein